MDENLIDPKMKRPKGFGPFIIFVSVLIIITGILIVLIILIGLKKTPIEQITESINIEKILGRWYVQGYIPSELDKNASNYQISFSRIDEKTLQMQIEYDISYERFKPLREADRMRTSVFILRMDLPHIKIGKLESHVQELSPPRFNVSFLKSKELWIIDNDTAYDWIILANSKGKYLWILTRNPKFPREEYNKLFSTVKKSKFNTNLLSNVIHNYK